MALTLDHIVIAVHDLEPSILDYQDLGFTVLREDPHPDSLTQHALVIFADGSYLELVAWRKPAPDERWWQCLQEHGEGMVDFALRPADADQALADAQARGLPLHEQRLRGRPHSNGEPLQWQTGHPTTHDLPFLCSDITPRAWRIPEGDVRRHANGATGVRSLGIAVRLLPLSLQRYRTLLGNNGTLGLQQEGEAPVASIQLRGTRLLLAQRHDVAQGPYALELSNRMATAPALDQRLTHGAAIRFATPAPQPVRMPQLQRKNASTS